MTKSFVVYSTRSTMQVGPTERGQPHTAYAKRYETRGGALRAAARWNLKAHEDGLVGPGPYGVAEYEHYRTRVVREVTRTNLLSGAAYREASNVPGYSSPASEAYWAM